MTRASLGPQLDTAKRDDFITLAFQYVGKQTSTYYKQAMCYALRVRKISMFILFFVSFLEKMKMFSLNSEVRRFHLLRALLHDRRSAHTDLTFQHK